MDMIWNCRFKGRTGKKEERREKKWEEQNA